MKILLLIMPLLLTACATPITQTELQQPPPEPDLEALAADKVKIIFEAPYIKTGLLNVLDHITIDWEVYSDREGCPKEKLLSNNGRLDKIKLGSIKEGANQKEATFSLNSGEKIYLSGHYFRNTFGSNSTSSCNIKTHFQPELTDTYNVQFTIGSGYCTAKIFKLSDTESGIEVGEKSWGECAEG